MIMNALYKWFFSWYTTLSLRFCFQLAIPGLNRCSWSWGKGQSFKSIVWMGKIVAAGLLKLFINGERRCPIYGAPKIFSILSSRALFRNYELIFCFYKLIRWHFQNIYTGNYFVVTKFYEIIICSYEIIVRTYELIIRNYEL